MTGFSVSGIEFGRIGVFQSGDMTGEFDQGDLHAQTDAEIRHLVFSCILGGGDLAFHTALAETARNQNGIVFRKLVCSCRFHFFGIEEIDIDLAIGMNARMPDRFDQRLVGFGQVDVFADMQIETSFSGWSMA